MINTYQAKMNRCPKRCLIPSAGRVDNKTGPYVTQGVL